MDKTQIISRPLNQRFLMTLIFVCTNCASFSHHLTISDSARITYYSGIFTAYLFMIFASVKLSQIPPLYIVLKHI